MPRMLDKNEVRTVLIEDRMDGGEVEFSYRSPTTKEKKNYDNRLTKNVRGKIVNRRTETRIEFGAKVLMGIRDGDFMIRENGKPRGLSSNPDSPDYKANWKEIVKENGSDLVALLGVYVFEGTADLVEADEEEYAEDDAEEGEDAGNC